MTRSWDTMSEAIALSSPSGSMSKRARKAAEQRLLKMLHESMPPPTPRDPRPGKISQLESRILILKGFVERGYRPRVHAKELAKAEAELSELKESMK
jgi:hypothetical protein